MIKLENVTKKYGDLTVFKDFSIEFKENETTAILGASGVGKTTILNMLAGITDCDEGKIFTENKVSYVFQTPNLIENLSVFKNIEIVLKGENKNKAEREKIIDEFLVAAGIYEKKYSPVYSLSGGQKQRVGIIRAFCYPSELLLTDEPFSSLDILLKMRLIDLYADLLQKKPRTAVLVSHSESEAIALADKIVVLGANRIADDFYVDDLRCDGSETGECKTGESKTIDKARPRDESSYCFSAARKRILDCLKLQK